MNSVLSSVLAMLGVVGIILLILYAYGRILKNRRLRTPLDPQVLRSPGQTIRTYIEGLDDAMRICMMALFSGAGLFIAGHLLLSYLGDVPDSLARTAVFAGGGSLFMGYFSWRWCRLRTRRRLHRLRLEGEVAVGRALDQLTEKGHRVYHDFPADDFNIDHIVIGPVGVMAVETKARSVGAARRRRQDAIVTYDGRMLHFPKNSDHQTIDQAKDQALWLSEWISEAVGDPISARAIVAIPDWHVKRTSADGIPVVNPKQFATLFDHIKPRPLPQDMIQNITRRIEQHYHEAVAETVETQPEN